MIYGHLVTREFRAAFGRGSGLRHMYVITLREPSSWLVSFYEELMLHEQAAFLKAAPNATRRQRALADNMCHTCVARDRRLSLDPAAAADNLATLAHEMCLSYANRVLDAPTVLALCARVPAKAAPLRYNTTTGLPIPLDEAAAAAAKLTAAEYVELAKAGTSDDASAAEAAAAVAAAQRELEGDCNMLVLINERWYDSLELTRHLLGEPCLPYECWDVSLHRNELSAQGRDGGYRQSSQANSHISLDFLAALGPTLLEPLSAVYNAAALRFDKLLHMART